MSKPHARIFELAVESLDVCPGDWLFVGDNRERDVVERLLSIGATRVEWRYPLDADYVVLADPDGNRFCVVQK